MFFPRFATFFSFFLIFFTFIPSVFSTRAIWAVCRTGASDEELQKALDYACRNGGNCTEILPNGTCFDPNTLISHCSYAVNIYFQARGQPADLLTNFSGVAVPTIVDPSYGECKYPVLGDSPFRTGKTPVFDNNGTVVRLGWPYQINPVGRNGMLFVDLPDAMSNCPTQVRLEAFRTPSVELLPDPVTSDEADSPVMVWQTFRLHFDDAEFQCRWWTVDDSRATVGGKTYVIGFDDEVAAGIFLVGGGSGKTGYRIYYCPNRDPPCSALGFSDEDGQSFVVTDYSDNSSFLTMFAPLH